jgi:hypothetical protein
VEQLIGGWSGDEALPSACRDLTQTVAPPPRNDDVCVVAARFGGGLSANDFRGSANG